MTGFSYFSPNYVLSVLEILSVKDIAIDIGGLGKARSYERSEVIDIAARQSVNKKITKEVQMLKE